MCTSHGSEASDSNTDVTPPRRVALPVAWRAIINIIITIMIIVIKIVIIVIKIVVIEIKIVKTNNQNFINTFFWVKHGSEASDSNTDVTPPRRVALPVAWSAIINIIIIMIIVIQIVIIVIKKIVVLVIKNSGNSNTK